MLSRIPPADFTVVLSPLMKYHPQPERSMPFTFSHSLCFSHPMSRPPLPSLRLCPSVHPACLTPPPTFAAVCLSACLSARLSDDRAFTDQEEVPCNTRLTWRYCACLRAPVGKLPQRIYHGWHPGVREGWSARVHHRSPGWNWSETSRKPRLQL